MARDYIGALVKESGDVEQHGVKGMKWGVRNGVGTPRADKKAAKIADRADRAAMKVGERPPSHKGDEAPAQRYERLLVKAKTQGANSFTDEELQFVTKRGNAIQQVNRLNEQKPGWVSEIARQILKQQAQKRLSAASDTLGKKYIDTPLASKSQ